MKKVLFTILALVLLIGMTIPMAIPAGAEESDTIYGITTSGEIYKLDPITGAVVLLDTVENCPTNITVGADSVSGPNGLAYCELTNRIYYTEYYANADNVNVDDAQTSLYFIDLDEGNEVFAGYLPGEIACADIYNGLYYYIAGGPQLSFTDDLYEVAFKTDGTIDTITEHLDITGVANHSWGFWGDIAIWDGVIYGFGDCKVAGHDNEFFKVNCDGTGFDLIAQTNYNLQLAFGLDGTLYGHSFQTKDNYVVTWDADAGTVTSTPLSTSLYSFTDLASGSTCTEIDTYSICGYKYADWEGEQIPLPDWEIILEQWDGDSFEPFATTATDENGKYCFTDLPAGKYRVSETLKDGWDQVYPDSEGENEGAHIVVLPGGETYAETDTVLYGTQRENPGHNGLYEINFDTQEATRLFDAGGSANSPNGLGFDSVNKRLYYMKVTEPTGPSNLYFYDLEAGTETMAGLNLTNTVVVGAGFYNGAYYYIPNLTADLHKVDLNPDGTAASDTAVWADFNGDNPAVYRFGDFAINRDGMLYSSTNGTSGSTAEFFKLDVNTGEYTLITTDPSRALNLQVSFGSDGTLYAHNAGTGEFYTVDLATGELSSIGYIESDRQAHELFSDLASGTQPMYYNFVNTPKLCCFDETAWAAQDKPTTTRFVTDKGNWATYVKYTVGNSTESDPAKFPLYAGQTHYAGDLLLWNDGNTLYAKYVASGEAGDYAPKGYCGGTWTGLTEYHLQVVDEFDGFNAYRTYNKNKGYGSPIPGQFDTIWEGDKVAETGPISINIDGCTNGDVYIAAHAVMWWCGYDCDTLAEIGPQPE